MARNTLRLDTSGFEKLLIKIEEMGGDVNKAVDDALTQAAGTIEEDTYAALGNGSLPAGGKYSHGDTKAAVVKGAQIEWAGQVASIPVGFDFSLPGAGGYLITGTPRMRPVAALNKMYKQKRYMRQIQEDISDVLWDYLDAKWGG